MLDRRDMEKLYGKTIGGFALAGDGCSMSINFTDGTVASFPVDGDCCSNSWIEHLEDSTGAVIGAQLTGYEEVDKGDMSHPDHECLTLYETRFVTSKGVLVAEFRNSSNGYYGGWMSGPVIG